MSLSKDMKQRQINKHSDITYQFELQFKCFRCDYDLSNTKKEKILKKYHVDSWQIYSRIFGGYYNLCI